MMQRNARRMTVAEITAAVSDTVRGAATAEIAKQLLRERFADSDMPTFTVHERGDGYFFGVLMTPYIGGMPIEINCSREAP